MTKFLLLPAIVICFCYVLAQIFVVIEYWTRRRNLSRLYGIASEDPEGSFLAEVLVLILGLIVLAAMFIFLFHH